MKFVMTEDDLRLIQRVARVLRPATAVILETPHDSCDAHAYAELLDGIDGADAVLFIHAAGMIEVEL